MNRATTRQAVDRSCACRHSQKTNFSGSCECVAIVVSMSLVLVVDMQLSRTQSTLAHANSAWGLARKVKCISYLLVKLRCLRVTCARH